MVEYAHGMGVARVRFPMSPLFGSQETRVRFSTGPWKDI